MRSSLFILFWSGIALVAQPAQGNLLGNGSFEMGPKVGPSVELAAGSSELPCWIVTRGPIDYVGTSWIPSDGVRSLDLCGSQGVGGIRQAFHSKLGTLYSIRFDLAGNPFGDPLQKSIRVEAAGQWVEFAFDCKGKTPSEMGWTETEWTFTGNAEWTTVEFIALDDGGSSAFGPAIDNVVVQEATPVEGSSWGRVKALFH